jgi:hypothetical protein
MKTIVLLAHSLAVVIAMNVQAQPFTEIYDTADVITWPIDWSSPDEPQEPLVTLNQYFEAGCALFGIHDDKKSDSQFFCIHKKSNGKIAGQWFFNSLAPGADFEGMDYDGNHIFVSAGDDAKSPVWHKGRIWRSESPSRNECRFYSLVSPNENNGVAIADGIAMEEVDGITFDNSGRLWGWAQEAGLFVVPSPVFNSLPNAALLLNRPGEVEDLEFLNWKLYGVLNLDHFGQVEDGDGEPHPNHPTYPEDVNAAIKSGGRLKANFIEYDILTGHVRKPCESQVVNALEREGFHAAEIEALEVLPPLPGVTEKHMLLGFHASRVFGKNTKSTFVIGILNLNQCNLELRSIRNIPGRDFRNRQLDVEGLTMVCPDESDDQIPG